MPKKIAGKINKKTVVKKAAKKTMKKAGRPKGSGKFGCATKAVRIPAHMEEEIQAFIKRKIKAEAK